MDLRLFLGAITLCATVLEVRGSDCPIAKKGCTEEYITFWLRTRQTNDTGELLNKWDIEKKFSKIAPLKVIIHGYKANKDYVPYLNLVSAYLEKDYYVLIVDWSKMAQENCQENEMYNAHVAGKCTSRVLQVLYAMSIEDWRDVTHIIGFGRGAHVAGIIGHYIRDLPRITGLDPALLRFYESVTSSDYILDPTDARFVDVYHSNAGAKGGLWPSGHVDFYINNGEFQPGCDTSDCNHHRSLEVFAESINTQVGFYGKPCELKVLSYIVQQSNDICPYVPTNSSTIQKAGEYVDQTIRGLFMFETNNKAPFGRGLSEEGREIQN